jgi:hypothetical protein
MSAELTKQQLIELNTHQRQLIFELWKDRKRLDYLLDVAPLMQRQYSSRLEIDNEINYGKTYTARSGR